MPGHGSTLCEPPRKILFLIIHQATAVYGRKFSMNGKDMHYIYYSRPKIYSKVIGTKTGHWPRDTRFQSEIFWKWCSILGLEIHLMLMVGLFISYYRTPPFWKLRFLVHITPAYRNICCTTANHGWDPPCMEHSGSALEWFDHMEMLWSTPECWGPTQDLLITPGWRRRNIRFILPNTDLPNRQRYKYTYAYFSFLLLSRYQKS